VQFGSRGNARVSSMEVQDILTIADGDQDIARALAVGRLMRVPRLSAEALSPPRRLHTDGGDLGCVPDRKTHGHGREARD
jgi:hypothetical protein